MMKEEPHCIGHERGKDSVFVEIILGADVMCSMDSLIGIDYFYRS